MDPEQFAALLEVLEGIRSTVNYLFGLLIAWYAFWIWGANK